MFYYHCNFWCKRQLRERGRGQVTYGIQEPGCSAISIPWLHHVQCSSWRLRSTWQLIHAPAPCRCPSAASGLGTSCSLVSLLPYGEKPVYASVRPSLPTFLCTSLPTVSVPHTLAVRFCSLWLCDPVVGKGGSGVKQT